MSNLGVSDYQRSTGFAPAGVSGMQLLAGESRAMLCAKLMQLKQQYSAALRRWAQVEFSSKADLNPVPEQLAQAVEKRLWKRETRLVNEWSFMS
jgi:hypothetical protein